MNGISVLCNAVYNIQINTRLFINSYSIRKYNFEKCNESYFSSQCMESLFLGLFYQNISIDFWSNNKYLMCQKCYFLLNLKTQYNK